MPVISPDDLCPCDSGQRARGCCLFGAKLLVRQADTRPTGPTTGYAHPKCYAAALNDCCEKISGEHPISKGVLEDLAGRAVWVRGFHWQKEGSQRIPVSRLESKVLCQRHNNALSPVDAQGRRLFRALAAVGAELEGGEASPRVRAFAGVDVERWILKVLMGLASSGSARSSEGSPLAWEPPVDWCRILFGQRTFVPSWGLYFSGTIGDGMRLDAGEISIAPLKTGDSISGLTIAIAGVRFFLVMIDIGARRTGALDDNSLRRPNELLFVDARRRIERSLCFTWSKGLEGGQVTLGWGTPPKA